LDESDLKDVFSEFHPRSANIPRTNNRSKGFGFVEFSSSKDQNEAVRALDQSEINGRLVTISVSNNRSSSPRRRNNSRDNNRRSRSRSPRRNTRNRSRSPRRRRSNTRRDNNNNNNNNNNRKSNVSSEPSKTNIYVSNIPFSITEKSLEEFFKDLKVAKLTIPKKRNGDSFGYAFVELASPEDQQKALKYNDTLLESRKIVVQAAYNRTPTTENKTQN